MTPWLGNRIASAALRRAVLFGLIGAFVMGFMVVNTVATDNLGNTTLKLAKETFSNDADVAITSQRVYKASTTVSATGDTPIGNEATASLPQINNAIQKSKWAYEFVMQEVTVDSWQSGENFKIEVYMDDGTTNDLIATLYSKQVNVDDGSIEGVTVVANTGPGNILGDLFSIVISRQ